MTDEIRCAHSRVRLSPSSPEMRSALRSVCLCVLVSVVFSAAASVGQPLPLPSLPYEYNALEPVLTEAAMRLHHLGHHQAYTDKLNVALRALRDRGGSEKALAKLGIDTMLAKLDQLPADLRQTIRNNGGGYVNHALYWQCMSPPNRTNADGTNTTGGLRLPAEGSAILSALTRDFGSFDAFRTQFTGIATALFGSGWVFLYVDGTSRTLKLMATPNQDNPATVDQNAHHVSLLTLDVWEHAYYLDFHNKRADFIGQWWSLVNWEQIDQNYSAFLTYSTVITEMAQGRAATKQATPVPAATPDAKDGL